MNMAIAPLGEEEEFFFASESEQKCPTHQFWSIPIQRKIDWYGEPLYSSILHKKGKHLKMFVTRKYYLCGNSLLYCKQGKNQDVKGIVNLDHVKCSFRLRTLKKRFSIVFQRNKAKIELFTEDETVFEDWQRYLRPRVILDDYSKKFKTEKMIGKGSYGKVFLAREFSDIQKKEADSMLKPIEAKYAVKVLEKERLKGRTKPLMLNETKILRALDHDSVIKLYEIHDLPQVICFVMNIIEGGELMKQMKAKGHYSEADCARILKKLLHALEYLQEKEIIHRDLKPENLLLHDKNDISSIVIADFGLSCYKTDAKMLNLRCGTPGYVAPEVLENKFTDHWDKIDVFSLGCIFHKLLSGNSPFFGTSAKDVIRLNRECKINYDSFVLSHVSPSAKHLLARMLEKDPAKRISVKEALEHEFLMLPAYELAENIINLEKRLLSYDAMHMFNLRNLKEKVDVSGGFYKFSLQSVGTFYACASPLMKGQINTIVDEAEDGNCSLGKTGTKTRVALSTNVMNDHSPTNQISNFTLNLVGGNGKRSTSSCAMSPLHRLTLIKRMQSNCSSRKESTHQKISVEEKTESEGGGFSMYIQNYQLKGLEEPPSSLSSENFSDIEESPELVVKCQASYKGFPEC